MNKADELWEKWIDRDESKVNGYDLFCSILQEYGAAVRKQDWKICMDKQRWVMADGNVVYKDDCASAIEATPLP